MFIYDNACNLAHFSLNREPEWFSKTLFLVDAYHFDTSHANCSPAFDVQAYKMHRNSQLHEQKNSLLDNMRAQALHLNQLNYLFMLRYFVYRLNRRQSVVDRQGVSII